MELYYAFNTSKTTARTVSDMQESSTWYNFKAISLRKVFENRFFNRKLCFLRAFTSFTPGVEPNWARSSHRTCDPLVRGI